MLLEGARGNLDPSEKEGVMARGGKDGWMEGQQFDIQTDWQTRGLHGAVGITEWLKYLD